MGLIRSLLVRLGMDTANFDAGAKRAKNSLFGMQSSFMETQRMLGSFGKTAIAFKVATAGLEGFTEWFKAAKEGASSTEIIGRGLYGFSQGIPIVGRLTKAFKELDDEITGTRESNDALKASLEYKKATKATEDDIKSRIKRLNAQTSWEEKSLDIEEAYKKTVDKINSDEKAADPQLKRRLKLEQEIAEMKKHEEQAKYTFSGPSFFETLHKKEDELAGLVDGKKFKEQLRLADEERQAGYNKLLQEMQDKSTWDVINRNDATSDKFMRDWKEKSNLLQDEIKQGEDATRIREANEKRINDLRSRYDTDRMRVEKEYQELLKHRAEIGEGAFGRGVSHLQRELLDSEYTKKQNPLAKIYERDGFVDVKALSATQGDVLIRKQLDIVTKEEQNLIRWESIIRGLETNAGIN